MPLLARQVEGLDQKCEKMRGRAGGRGVPFFSIHPTIIICPHPAFGHFLARPSGERGLQRARQGGSEEEETPRGGALP